MWEEFKKFAFRGNVLDMAVGVIIGTAFGKIVSSLVNDIFMPVIGNIVGGSNMSALKLVLSPAEVDAAGTVIKEEAAILYGSFLQNVIDFFLIAICIFFFVKVVNKLTTKKEQQEAQAVEEAPKAPTVEELLTDIRDLLQQK